ncbi:unnamed protein product, partial [Pocillopora meandrina]
SYRNPAKSRLTETADHFIAAKRPFKLAIPATKWNTLDDEIASKIPKNNAGKPWVWLQNIREHYTGTTSEQKYHKQTKPPFHREKPLCVLLPLALIFWHERGRIYEG